MAVSGNSLIFQAGRGAFEDIRKHGFSVEQIGTIVGASGGAKWLVLSQLDRVILDRIVPKIPGPLHLLGSSIGAWRFSCYTQNDPVAAIRRFERAYVEQRYSRNPDAKEISESGRTTLELILGETGAADVMKHPKLRTHMMTVKSRLITSSDNKYLLGAGLESEYAHSLIGRSIFIRYLEDRGVLNESYFKKIVRRKPEWREILNTSVTCSFVDSELENRLYPRVLCDKEFTYALFNQLSKDFNGDMFPNIDDEKENLKPKYIELDTQIPPRFWIATKADCAIVAAAKQPQNTPD